MARTYPLSVAAFWGTTNLQTSKFSLSESRQFNQTGGGQLIDASLGTRLWTAEASLVPDSHNALARIESALEVLLEPGASFLVYDKRREFPQADPSGSLTQASAVTLSAVAANNRDVTLAGLPGGFIVTAGDMFSFTYGSAPLRYALHRVVVGGVANSGGTGVVEVVPPIRPGYTLGVPVVIQRPYMLAKIIPGSYMPSVGGSGRLSSGVTFGFSQSLRV